MASVLVMMPVPKALGCTPKWLSREGGRMKRGVLAVLVGGLVLFVAGMPVLAHHSFAAAFDMSKPVTVQGTIVQVRLENPHSWFFLDVKDPSTGKVERWAFEAG